MVYWLHLHKLDFEIKVPGIRLKIHSNVLLAMLLATTSLQCDAASSKQLMEQGNALLNKKDFKQANLKFKAALNESPNSYDAMWGRAQALIGSGDEATDKPLAERMIKAAPYDYRSYLFMARVCVRKKDNKNAVRAADEAIRLNPKCAQAYLAKAMAKFVMSEFSEQDATNEAVTLLRTALKLDPHVDGGNQMLGAIYALQKQFKEAIGEFDKAIANDPKNWKGYEYRSMAWAAVGNHEKSLLDVNKVIELEPDNWRHYILRAQTYEQLKQLDKAIADYDKGIKMFPQHYRTRFQRAALAFKLKKYQICIDDYTAILGANALDDDALKLRGDCYMHTGNLKKALMDYNEAIDLSPESMTYYRARAVVYDKLRENGKALADRQKADKLKSKAAVDKI